MNTEKVKDNCAIVLSRNLHDGYSMIQSLQHRGREACGLFAFGKSITAVKWAGTVRMFDLVDLYRIFDRKEIYWWGFHVRYATRGRKQEILKDAHPHVIGGRVIDNGNHVIIENCDMAIIHNGQVETAGLLQSINPAELQSGCDSEALLHFYRANGARELLSAIPGAYVLAIADRFTRSVLVMKDRHAVKPGVIGIKDGEYCVASENVAFLKNGARVIEELEPGSLYRFMPNGEFNREQVVEANRRSCFFEWNYFADLESTINGIPVRIVREALGVALAKQFIPEDADFISYLPRCPETAARSYYRYYQGTGGKKLRYWDIFYKMRGERSFLGSSSADRKNSINDNLFLNPLCRRTLRGKVIIIIDDSLIRGNAAQRGIEELGRAGAKKVYWLSYTPPIGIRTKKHGLHGCVYGVDMPIEPPAGDEYLARDRDQEEISRLMSQAGVKVEVIYLTLDNMLSAFASIGLKKQSLCHFCVGGPRIY